MGGFSSGKLGVMQPPSSDHCSTQRGRGSCEIGDLQALLLILRPSTFHEPVHVIVILVKPREDNQKDAFPAMREHFLSIV